MLIWSVGRLVVRDDSSLGFLDEGGSSLDPGLHMSFCDFVWRLLEGAVDGGRPPLADF